MQRLPLRILVLLLELMMLAKDLFLHACVHCDCPWYMEPSHLGLSMLNVAGEHLPMLHFLDPMRHILMPHGRIHRCHAIFRESLPVMGATIKIGKVESEFQKVGEVILIWGRDHGIMVVSLGPSIAGLIHAG